MSENVRLIVSLAMLLFVLLALLAWQHSRRKGNNVDFKKLIRSKDGQTHLMSLTYFYPRIFSSWEKCAEMENVWLDEKITYMQNHGYEILDIKFACNGFGDFAKIFILYK